MSDLPDPLTPADCDLRGYDFMPLHGGKLFGSRFYMKSLRNPRAGLAAIKLWWAAWQQCPAGSLPNDDDDLSILADFGTDTKGWTKCRDVALHGFVLCSDGRLYHPMLCAEAKDAYARRVSERERKAAQRAAKKNKTAKKEGGTSEENAEDVPDVSHGTTEGQDAGRDADFRSDRTVTGQDSNTLLPSVVEVGAASDAPKPKSVRASRLPADWQPDPDQRQYALDRGLDPEREAENFRDYWQAKAGQNATKTDWGMTWRSWVRSSAERRPQRQRGAFPTADDRRRASDDAWANVQIIPGT